jgi:hypothetical protein
MQFFATLAVLVFATSSASACMSEDCTYVRPIKRSVGFTSKPVEWLNKVRAVEVEDVAKA